MSPPPWLRIPDSLLTNTKPEASRIVLLSRLTSCTPSPSFRHFARCTRPETRLPARVAACNQTSPTAPSRARPGSWPSRQTRRPPRPWPHILIHRQLPHLLHLATLKNCSKPVGPSLLSLDLQSSTRKTSNSTHLPQQHLLTPQTQPHDGSPKIYSIRFYTLPYRIYLFLAHRPLPRNFFTESGRCICTALRRHGHKVRHCVRRAGRLPLVVVYQLSHPRRQ